MSFLYEINIKNNCHMFCLTFNNDSTLIGNNNNKCHDNTKYLKPI